MLGLGGGNKVKCNREMVVDYRFGNEMGVRSWTIGVGLWQYVGRRRHGLGRRWHLLLR